MQSNENPLEVLLVDESRSVNLTELAQILKPFVVIDKASHQIQFLPHFYEEKNDVRILLLLAASKARKELLGDKEKLSPSDIIKLDIMPKGSVKATLKKLYDRKNIRAENKKYYLPNYQVRALLTRFKPDKNE